MSDLRDNAQRILNLMAATKLSYSMAELQRALALSRPPLANLRTLRDLRLIEQWPQNPSMYSITDAGKRRAQ